MTMYMYPINIQKDKQVINYSKDIDISCNILTLDFISKHVGKDDSFTIEEDILTIFKKRLETTKELNLRVKKQEDYMKNYNNFHAKNKFV